jgi:DNA replication protein DnaC
MRVEIFDEHESFIEFPTRRACTHCHKGLDMLIEWQTERNYFCQCDYGWVPEKMMVKKASGRIEEITALVTCRCSEGASHRLEMDRLINLKRQERLNKLIAGGGITEEIAAKTFDNFNTHENTKLEEVREKVKAVADRGESLLLVGNPGQGKTHLAAAYLNQWVQARGRSGAFVSLVDLMSSLRKTIRAEGGPDWDSTLDRYIEAELLVLDDLGQEKASEKVIEVVFHLLNSRINRGKPTVVTTNFSLKKLAADVGYPGSICSRLSSFNQVAWVSEDYRLRVVDLWDRPGA